MKAYWKLIAILLGVFLFAGTAQGTIIVTPDSQEVLIGGNGTYNVTIGCTQPFEYNIGHNLTIMFQNASTGAPTDKLKGNITYADSSPEIELQQTDDWTPSQPAYSWNPPQKGEYNFTLTVEVNETAGSVQAGESFGIRISDNTASTNSEDNVLTVDAVTVPELNTAALIGIGLMSLVFWHRRN